MSIGKDKAGNAKIENGDCCVVFASPESLLAGKWSVEEYVVFGHLQKELNRNSCG